MSPEPSAAEQQLIAAHRAVPGTPTESPFGPADEIGMLNLIDAGSRRRILGEADAGKVFDLSVDFFLGMPSWQAFGDPPYQICLTHSPRGEAVDDSVGVGREAAARISYSGDAISTYTHCGTHIDSLCHWGYHGVLFNGFRADEHLGRRHWHRGGVDKQPPIVARGVLIDVAAAKGVDVLPPSYGIGEADLREALRRQGAELRVGDVPFIRTGAMRAWPDPSFLEASPGITVEGARFLARAGAIVIGADNIALEQVPGDPEEASWTPVHSYLLTECGIAMLEVADLEEIAAEQVYEFALVAAAIRFRGATGAPIRPLAFPLR